MRALLSIDGSPLDETPAVYDQAFLIFALAGVFAATGEPGLEGKAAAVRDLLAQDVDAIGGLKEAGAHPYQSNAHMHLLEAALAWEQSGGDASWSALADQLVLLARTRFIDPETGSLREFFDSNWAPAPGEDGRLIEPGHQVEWAWLMARYGRRRNAAEAVADAWRLYGSGLRGVHRRRGVAVDAMDIDGGVRSARSRLWPQTEWLKASLILAELSEDGRRDACLDQAARALRALWRYLTPQGLWHDKMLEDGSFIDEPAPASSFYHIMAAYGQLRETIDALFPEKAPPLGLS